MNRTGFVSKLKNCIHRLGGGRQLRSQKSSIRGISMSIAFEFKRAQTSASLVLTDYSQVVILKLTRGSGAGPELGPGALSSPKLTNLYRAPNMSTSEKSVNPRQWRGRLPQPRRGPSWGHPRAVLGAIGSLLEPFLGIYGKS